MNKIILFLIISIFLNTLFDSNAVAKTYEFTKCIYPENLENSYRLSKIPEKERDQYFRKLQWSNELWNEFNVVFTNFSMVKKRYKNIMTGELWLFFDKPDKILKILNNKNLKHKEFDASGLLRYDWEKIKHWETINFLVDTNSSTIKLVTIYTDDYKSWLIKSRNYVYDNYFDGSEKNIYTRNPNISPTIDTYSITGSSNNLIIAERTWKAGERSMTQNIVLDIKKAKVEMRRNDSYRGRTSSRVYLPLICKPLNYSSSKSSGTLSKTFSYWWVVFILIALGGFIYTQLKPGKTKNFKIPKLRISSQKNVIFTFIPKLWRGDFPLAISFWACLIIPSTFFTLLVRIPVTGAAEIILGYFAIFFYIYSFIAIKGTWYSANNYKAEKEKKKETYGWAIAAQIYILMSVLGFIIRIFRLIL